VSHISVDSRQLNFDLVFHAQSVGKSRIVQWRLNVSLSGLMMCGWTRARAQHSVQKLWTFHRHEGKQIDDNFNEMSLFMSTNHDTVCDT